MNIFSSFLPATPETTRGWRRVEHLNIGELLNPAAVNTTTHHIVEVGQAP
jgi:hypothetical protein